MLHQIILNYPYEKLIRVELYNWLSKYNISTKIVQLFILSKENTRLVIFIKFGMSEYNVKILYFYCLKQQIDCSQKPTIFLLLKFIQKYEV